jgi:gliding motility-associated-like protein
MLKSKNRNGLLAIIFFFIAVNLYAQKDLVISGGNTVSSFVCANRTAYVWGSNAAGQLGLHDVAGNPITTDPVIVPTAITKFNGLTNAPDVKQINSGSGSHFVALTCSGDVWAWGVNGSGQIGNNSSGGIVAIPTRVIANPAVAAANRGAGNVLTNAAVVYSGTVNTFAILNDGRLVSWGGNSGAQAGQLGQGNTADAFTANYVKTGPGATDYLTGVVQIFAGDNVAYALVDPDGDGIGTVYSWGNGLNGTLGRDAAGTGNPAVGGAGPAGQTVQDSYARPVYYLDGTQMNNIKQLQAGDVFGIALDVDGYVWTWGNGGWNNSTGNTTVNYTGSDPRRVIAGTTTGASNDGQFLLAKAIGGGQGYGMAVTADGKPVAWGGSGVCGSGGMTGTGATNGTAALPPSYIKYGPGAGDVHNNVTLINRGDTWGFYGTSDNNFYAWGCNTVGQLGIGNTTNQPYATQITPPTDCDFRDPAPFADLKQNDISVCQEDFTAGPGLVLNSNFTILASIAFKYTVSWYRNGTALANRVKTGPASVASNLTYTATQDGTYTVIITYTGTNAGCVVYDPAIDDMTITYFTPSFTVPTNLTFCGPSATVRVNSTNATSNPVYAWYPTAASTTELGRTVGNGTTVISTTGLAGTTTKTVYVEEIRQKKGAVFPGATAIGDANGINNNESYIETSVPISLDSIAVYLRQNSSGTATLSGRMQVYGSMSDCGGKTVANKSNVLYSGVTFSVSTTSATFITRNVPVGILLPPGKYFIGFSTATSLNGGIVGQTSNVAGFGNSGTTLSSNTPLVDNIGGTSVSFFGADQGTCLGNSGYSGNMYNFQFSIPQGYCNRIPVTLTESCPCSRPTNVTITTPAAATVTICQGTAQALAGTVTVPAAAQNTAFTYSWRKVGTATPLQTGTITPTIATAFAVPGYAGITGTLLNAGQYILRVEDGNTNSASCFRDDTLTLVVNATTVPGVIASSQTICTGENPAAFTVTTAASGGDGTTYTYQWEKSIGAGAYGNMTAATNATFDEGVLTNATTAAVIHNYRRKVTSGVCPEVTSNIITITVNPAVVPGVVAGNQTICSGGNPAAFTQTTAATGGNGTTYTYVWQSSTTSASAGFTNITPAVTTATYDVPAGLTTTTYYRRVDASGTCVTANTNVITVTVQPPLVAGVIAAAQTICTGENPAAFTVTTPASGGDGTTYTYQWEKSTNGGTYGDITGAATATFDEGVLTNAGTTVMTVDYRRKVTSGECAQQTTAAIRITVTPAVVPGVVAGNQTICSGGNPAAFTQTTAATGGTGTHSYVWQSSTTSASAGFTNITPAVTTATYDVPAGLTTTTYYRRVDVSGTCTAANTNVVTITIDPAVTQATITADQAICSGATPSLIGGPVAAGGSATATASYVWERAVAPFTPTPAWVVIPSETSKDYQPPALTAETWYRRIDKKGECAGVASTIVKITITALAPATVTLSQTPTGPICEGTNVDFTASVGNGGTPTYVWSSSVRGVLPSTISTYSSSALVDGEVIRVDITSSLGCASPATADASSTMVVTSKVTPTVTLTADQTAICPGDAVNYTATSTHGGTGTYTWSGTPTAAGTGSTYSTTDLAAGNSINVTLTTSLTCVTSPTAVSSPVSVTVRPVPAVSVSISPLTQSICENNAASFTATASGTGLGTGTTYEWFVTSASTPGPPAESQGAPSTTATSFSTSALTSTKNKVYVQVVSHEQCASPTAVSSAVAVVTVNAGIGAGTIGSDQEICNNGTPVTITETGAPAGTAGTLTYVWQQTATPGDPLSWVPATTGSASNGGKDFIPSGAFTSDIYYQRIVTDAGSPAPCNVATSNTIHIKVSPSVAAGSIVGNEGTCSGTATGTITSGGLPTGGQGTFTYVWEQTKTPGDPLSWTATSGTGTTYNAGSLTETTHFRRREVNSCGTVYSNVIEKTVSVPETVTASIDNTAGPVCITEPSIVFTATASTTGTGTLSYEWYLGPVSAGNKVGNSSTYTYSPLRTADNDKEVRVVVSTSVGCNNGSATSAPYVLNIVTSVTPTVNITTNNNPQCAGLPVTFTAVSTGGGGLATYQWYVVPAGSPANAVGNPVGTGALTYRTTGLANGDRVYVSMTSSSGCLAVANPIKSNEIIMEIRPVPAPVIVEGDQTICSPNSFTFHGTVTAGNTYEWRLNTTRVVGTGVDFTATESGTYTLHESNGICNAPSSPVVLTVIESPVANAGLDVYMKQGDLGMLNGGGGSSGASYSWSPSGSLSSGIISNPVFTATQTTTYTLTVTESANGVSCPSVDDVTVFVVKPVVVPNVITVNGDGTNDDWEIENIDGYPNVIIEIYNRWGNLVWKTEGYPKNWDGTNFRNGEVLPDGTYFYIINLQSQIYNEPLTGWVQVIK